MIINQAIPYINIEEKNNLLSMEKETKPGLIIEGNSDFVVYDRMLMISEYCGDIDLVIGESKSNILNQHDEKKIDFPYIILLDADYNHYTNEFREDKVIIYTHFYSIEGYLTTENVIEKTIEDFKCQSCKDVECKEILKKVHDLLQPIINICLLKLKHGWCFKLEGFNLSKWYDEKNKEIDVPYLENYVKGYVGDFDWNEGEKLLESITINLDCIIHGRIKLQAIYSLFKEYFPSMKGRSLNIFTLDLCKNIINCNYSKQLVKKIDLKISSLCSCQ